MSEIMRGILDATCVFSAPTYYNVPIAQANNGLATAVPLTGRLQCKSDRYFLMTGLQFYSVPGSTFYQEPNSSRIVQVLNLNTNKVYFNSSDNMQSINCGDNAMNAMTLPEYILWYPNELIGVNTTGISTDALSQSYCVLTGIEYAR